MHDGIGPPDAARPRGSDGADAGRAHDLFAERGYAAVKMDEIAAAVGVTKPLLYNYFGNKERLYIACMERAGDALTATVAEAVGATASPREALRAGVHAFFSFLDSDRAAWAVLFDETLPRGGEVADRVAEYRGPHRRPGLRLDRRPAPRERRDAARVETEALSTALLGAAEALARWWLRTEALGAEDAAELLIATVEPGLRGRAAPNELRHPPNKERRQQMNSETRRVAVVGGNRIPFARSNSTYAHASNQDMLTAALDGLIDRFGLEGERLGEVAGGAVLKHSRDRDLTRESVLGTRLAPETPAYDVQQACGTGLETTILVANKIALGQIDAGIACGADTTSDAPIALNEELRETLLEANRQRSTVGKLRALTGVRPGHIVPAIPRNEEPRTGLSMGEHCAIMADRMGDRPRASRTSSRSPATSNLAAAYERGFLDDLITAYLGLERDQNLRPDSSLEKLAKLKPVFGGPEGTMTAANSTPLSDGASAVLLASEEWAKERGLPVLAYFAEAQTAAVDHVHKREGLLMAPAYAMPTMLDRAGLALQDFDYYEIHEAFAAQVLCTLKAWEDADFCKEKLGRDEAARLDRPHEAQRQRRLAGRRPPVRGDRRADRRRARQAAARRRRGPRRDQHLRRRRPGRRRDPRKRRGWRQMSDRYSQIVNAPGRLDGRQAARPAAAGRASSATSPSAPVVAGPVLSGAAPGGRLGRTARGFPRLRSRPNGPAPRAGRRRSSSTPPGSPTRPSWSSCSASSTPRSAACSAAAASSSSARRRPKPARPAPRPRSGRWRASPARSARRSAAAAPPRSSSTSPPAPRTSSTRRCASCSRPARPTSPARWCGSAPASPRPRSSIGSARSTGKTALVTGASRGIGAAIAATLARDGAKVVGLDVPPALSGLRAVTGAIGGEALGLDITAADAPERIAEHFADGGVDVVVHNAGVTKRPHDREDAGGALDAS